MVIWEMGSTLSLPLLPGPLWLGVVALDMFLSMGQIEETRCKQMTDVELWLLYSNTWNNSTAQKRAQVCLRMLAAKCTYKSYIYLIYMYKHGLALNSLQWFICHKTKPNATIREYQASLASHSPVWFIIFMNLAKASTFTELYLTLPQYCKSFDSLLYIEI